MPMPKLAVTPTGAGSKPVHIGYFDSQQDAARAYDQEAIRLRGPNTSLNYPITDYDVSGTYQCLEAQFSLLLGA